MDRPSDAIGPLKNVKYLSANIRLVCARIVFRQPQGMGSTSIVVHIGGVANAGA